MSSVDQAKAIINSTFGVTLTNAKLLKVANAFVEARSDLIPTETVFVDGIPQEQPVAVTTEIKAEVVIAAVRELITNTVRGIARHQAERDNATMMAAVVATAENEATADLS